MRLLTPQTEFVPDGTVFGIKEWHGEEVIVPVPPVQFNEFFPPRGDNMKEAQNEL